jgi:hypothetical protein
MMELKEEYNIHHCSPPATPLAPPVASEYMCQAGVSDYEGGSQRGSGDLKGRKEKHVLIHERLNDGRVGGWVEPPLNFFLSAR